MADLRSNFESTLVTLRNQPFELRWAHYWSVVLEALEVAPETLEHLNRLIVGQEDQLAAAEDRPTTAKMLGAERGLLRREADDAVMQLLRPYFDGQVTPADRAAVTEERRRIRSEIHPHTQHADGADAYETYVLVLDYATAFASAAAAAFRSEAVRQPRPRAVQPAHSADTTLRHQRPAPDVDHRAPQTELRPSSPRPDPGFEHRARQPSHRSEPPAGHQPGRPEPYATPREDRRPDPTDVASPPAAPGTVQLYESREPKPIPIAMPEDARGGRGRLVGWLVAASLVVCLIAAGGAAYVFKFEWFDLSNWQLASGEDTTQSQVDAEADTPDETTTEAAPEADQPGEEIPSTPLDRFYAAIMNTTSAVCTPPSDVSNSNWTEISAFVDCTKSQGVELISTFRFMLSQAGGKWSEVGNWSAPEGDMRVQLVSAWRHITQTRQRWTAQSSATIKEYASSYFGFQSHGTTGWRFAAWRCRCNLSGEFVGGDTTNVKPRVFITRPAFIQTEDEARQAYTQVRNFFLGPNAPGNAQAVEQAANDAALPYDLPGGLGMARPLRSQQDAQKAWEEVTALHVGIGFEVSELKWADN